MSKSHEALGGEERIRPRKWDVFISYSTQNAVLARSLAKALEARSFSIYEADLIAPGVSLEAESERSLRDSGSVIVLLSAESISSEWLRREVEVALGLLPPEGVIPVAVGEIDLQRLPKWLKNRKFLHLGAEDQIDLLVASVEPAIRAALTATEFSSGIDRFIGDAPKRIPLVGITNYLHALNSIVSGVTWIVGAAGSGKTALASEYAHITQDSFPRVLWVPGWTDFLSFDRALMRVEGFVNRDLVRDDNLPASIPLVVLDGFEVKEPHDAWQLIELSRFARIVVTSQTLPYSSALRDPAVSVVFVGPVRNDEISKYLSSMATFVGSPTPGVFSELAEIATSSPTLLRTVALALEQGIQYDHWPEDGHDRRMTVDWIMESILQEFSPRSRRRIGVLAYCAKMLPRIQTDGDWAEPYDAELFQRLTELGLCLTRKGHVVLGHKIVASSLRRIASRTGLADAATFVERHLPDPESKSVRAILPAVMDIADAAEQDRVSQGSPALVELLVWAASVWRAEGEPKRARQLGLRAFEAARRVDDPMTEVRVLNLRSAIAFDSGDLDLAMELERTAVSLASEHLGSSHPTTIASLSNLAMTLRARGHYSEAVSMLRHVVSVGSSDDRFADADNLTALNNLAICLRETGQYTEAFTILESALLRTHKGTLWLHLRQNLGALLVDLGRLDEAARLLEGTLAMASELEEAGSLESLLTRANIATIYARRGDLESALKAQHEVVLGFEVSYGPDHPKSLSAKNNLAAWLAEAGQLHAAIKLLRKVVERRTAVLGADNPETLLSGTQMAGVLRDLGDDHEAYEIFVTLSRQVTMSLGPFHTLTFQVREGIARQQLRLGNISSAQLSYRELIADMRQVLPADHPYLEQVIELASKATVPGRRSFFA